ncbi:MAG: Maf family protein [Elusimicrobiota bacterium]
MGKKIVLGSRSPRRQKLLKELGLKYKIIIPDGNEISLKKRPSAIAVDIAKQKAKEVADKVNQGIIICADTIVVHLGEIIGKPKSVSHAKTILRNIGKGKHYVYTGIVVKDLYTGKEYKDYAVTGVKMKSIPENKIDYLAKKNLDKAGAYGIQEKGDDLVESINGDYYNVVGMPVKLLVNIVKKCGIKINKEKARKLFRSASFGNK